MAVQKLHPAPSPRSELHPAPHRIPSADRGPPRARAQRGVELPEVIILKDRHGQLSDYAETDDTTRWREEVRSINRHIAGADLSILSGCSLVDDIGAIRTTDAAVRRI